MQWRSNGHRPAIVLELQPVVVSEIPNDKEELEAYLRLTGLPGVRVSKPICFCFVLFFVFCFVFLFSISIF
jgi:hypothetical protein